MADEKISTDGLIRAKAYWDGVWDEKRWCLYYRKTMDSRWHRLADGIDGSEIDQYLLDPAKCQKLINAEMWVWVGVAVLIAAALILGQVL